MYIVAFTIILDFNAGVFELLCAQCHMRSQKNTNTHTTYLTWIHSQTHKLLCKRYVEYENKHYL